MTVQCSRLIPILAMVAVFSLAGSRPSSANVLLNGDFSNGCNDWTFTDVSEPYQGSHPWATIDCSSGYADVHLHEMYGRGLQEQSFTSLRPQQLVFDYWNLLTSDYSIATYLYRDATEVLCVYCESGSIPYFNRVIVYLFGTPVIWENGGIPSGATVQLDITDSELVVYVNAAEHGRYALPPDTDLTCNRIGIRPAISNHIDVHIMYDNIVLEGSGGPPSEAACCLPDGSCEVLSASECSARGGAFHAGSPSCQPSTCSLVRLAGHVTQNGQDLQAVTVTATGTDATYEATTGADGRYSMMLSAGQYRISAQMDGTPGMEFFPNYDIGVFVDMTSVDFVEDHEPPTIQLECRPPSRGSFGSPPETYAFHVVADEAARGGSPLQSIELALGSVSIAIAVPPGATRVETGSIAIPDPTINPFSLLGNGDFSAVLRAGDRWGHVSEVSYPLVTRVNAFRVVEDGFHFPNFGLLGNCLGMCAASVCLKTVDYDLNGSPDNNMRCGACPDCGSCGCEVPALPSPLRLFIDELQWFLILPGGVFDNLWLRIHSAIDMNQYLPSEFALVRDHVAAGWYYPLVLASGGQGGHAVVPYGTLEFGNDQKYIHVYDPNFPRAAQPSSGCLGQGAPLSLLRTEGQWQFTYDASYSVFGEYAAPISEVLRLWEMIRGFHFDQLFAEGTQRLSTVVGEIISGGLSGMAGGIGAWVRIGSPVDAYVEDALGRKLGFLGQTTFDEIPGGEMRRTNESVEFYVPAPCSCRVLCVGTGQGVLHQDVFYPRAPDTVDRARYETDVTPGCVTSTAFGSSFACTPMQKDTDGDGTYETSLDALYCRPNWVLPDTVFTCDARAEWDAWCMSWLVMPHLLTRCLIGNLPDGHDVTDIIPASIRLNEILPPVEGGARIVSGAAEFSGPALELDFNAAAAVSHVGDLMLGEEHVVLLSGSLRDGSMFYAQLMIEVVPAPEPCWLAASIDIDPDVLNLKSKGQWITSYIELPEGYHPRDIVRSSVFFNRAVRAAESQGRIEDYDRDGIPDLMVKFDRGAVAALLTPGDSVEVEVTGMVGEEMFGGSDVIRVIMPGRYGASPDAPEIDAAELPTILGLDGSSPNPFSMVTGISYSLPTDCEVELTVHDATGRRVRTLVAGREAAGYKVAPWDGTDDAGRRLPAGIYFYRLEAENYLAAKKLILLK